MNRSRFSFLRRVRIHGGECGAVARALHHEARIDSLPAALEKVSKATLERKVMSKKTFFKRVAVTAVAALGFGMISIAPSQAVVTVSTVSFDADDSLTLSSTSSDSATATLTQTFAATAAADSATVYVAITSANASYATLGIRVSDSSTSSTIVAGNASTSPNINFGNTATDAMSPTQAQNLGAYTAWSRNDSRTVALNTSGAASGRVSYTVGLHSITRAGTYTVVANVVNYTAGSGAGTSVASSATWTVTVTGADTTAVAANTTSRIYAGTSAGTTDSAVVVSSSTLPTTAAANIVVTQKNAANGTAAESMTATIAGPGFLTTSATKPATGAGVKTVTAVAGDTLYVWPDGTAGTSTITVLSFSGVTLGTETITFHGSRNKIAVDTSNYTIGRAGNGSIGYATGAGSGTLALTDVPAFVVTVKDSGDRPVSGATVSILPTNTAIVASGTCAENEYAANPGNTGGKGFYNCSFTTAPTAKSGDTTTLTVRMTDPAVTTSTAYITTTVTVTIGGTVATEVASFDKATYEPGEKMVYTITAKDSSGNPVYDGASAAALTCNKTIGGSLTDEQWAGVYVGGKSVAGDNSYERLFAPGVGGKFKCSGNGGTLGLSVITAEAAVTDAAMAAAESATDAALEAIDAANAATDAANLAAEAADAATVAAEEARDAADAATAAVEALATEVATLMAALKAQITTLANTVAKIAKKVKA
jgi:hypothetical protein